MANMQKELDQEKMKRTKLENQVGNIPKKLKEYEMELQQLVKEIGQKMEMVTSVLCVMATSLGKKSNEEIMSPNVVVAKIPSGTSK